MSHPRFTVIHRKRFEDELTLLWLNGSDVRVAMDRLEPVLRTIPDQAGRRFQHKGEKLWYLEYNGFEIIYAIRAEDCQVQLISIRQN